MMMMIIVIVILLTIIARTDLSENHDESRLTKYQSRSIL